jgi:predicted lactoylglutathione lyase
MRQIFVNLPVADVAAAKDFYAALGFANNPEFSDANAVCMVVAENISVMLLAEDFFRTFINGEIADRATTETLLCISVDTRAEVDETVAKAIAAGGKPWKPSFEMGPMYGGSFADPDGHVWELMHFDASAAGA